MVCSIQRLPITLAKVNSGEYKLMGLTPYGEQNTKVNFEKSIDLKDDGSFRLNMKYFNYATGLTMTIKNLIIFGQKTESKNY